MVLLFLPLVFGGFLKICFLCLVSNIDYMCIYSQFFSKCVFSHIFGTTHQHVRLNNKNLRTIELLAVIMKDFQHPQIHFGKTSKISFLKCQKVSLTKLKPCEIDLTFPTPPEGLFLFRNATPFNRSGRQDTHATLGHDILHLVVFAETLPF